MSLAVSGALVACAVSRTTRLLSSDLDGRAGCPVPFFSMGNNEKWHSRYSLDEGKMPRASKLALRLPVKLLLGALLGAARGSPGRVLVGVED